MVIICALGAASQDVFLSGKGISSQLDASSNEYVEEFKLGAKLNVEHVLFATGGGATNAAVTFSRQGLEASFIGRVGKDIAGHGVLSELDKEHVDTSKTIYDEVLGTQYSTILVTESGERTILVYRGAAQAHTAKEYEEIDFKSYGWLYVSSFGGAYEALDIIFDHAKKSGIKIAFNPGQAELDQPELLKGLLEDVEVLLLNKDEAALVVEGSSSEELAHHLLHYVPVAVVSDGPNGVVATDGKTIIEAGMYEDVPVIDRTGAGDAFGSGFVSQYAQGKSIKEAVVFGSANSTSVVTKFGAKEGILHQGTVLHDMPVKEREF
ncbi:MAG: PfkB family kinase, nonfunctional [Candidatus Saccharibacteria bacterium]|nr:PfkB family kinase, nonfunctional [Candidatus Saccharibacteria bacterium]